MRRPSRLFFALALSLAGAPAHGLPARVQPVQAPAACEPAAQDKPAASTAPTTVPPTRMGLQLLVRCPVVVVARTISVRDAGLGSSLLHVRVLERMLGRAEASVGDDLPVFSASQQFLFGDEDLLFLRPYRNAGRYEVIERVNARDPHYAAKLSYARRNVWLTEVRDHEERVDATLSLLFSLLQSSDEWTALQALDELRWMAGELPDGFTPGRIQRMRAAGRTCLRKEVTAGIENVATLLLSRADRAAEGRDKGSSRP